jgi:hypothetical protein
MPDGFTVDEVCRLLAKSASAVHGDENLRHTGQRGSPFRRDDVVLAHRKVVAELEEKLQVMRRAAAELGVEQAPLEQAPRGLDTLSSAGGTPGLDNPLSVPTPPIPTPEIVQLRIDQAVAQQEIDRLKSEIRDANRLIDRLKEVVDLARPRENVGLDDLA